MRDFSLGHIHDFRKIICAIFRVDTSTQKAVNDHSQFIFNVSIQMQTEILASPCSEMFFSCSARN